VERQVERSVEHPAEHRCGTHRHGTLLSCHAPTHPRREGGWMPGLLKGKVAIITGAGGGIGRAHALALAAEGARVVVNDVGGDRHGGGANTRPAEAVVDEIEAAGGEAMANFDTVATREGADGILWTALAKFGRVDILVNNAGILRDRTLLNMSADDLDRVLDVHLRGTFFCTQAVARQMKVQGTGGRIINTTSISGMIGNYGQGNYAAAKAGIYGLTRVAALELQKIGITVNAVAPVALTRMTDDLAMFRGISADELGPQHVAPVVVFLASDLAADVTGQVVGVQGGKIFLYRVETTPGVEREPGSPWTAESIHEAWAKITA
jgi:NAD(P)-dependent dehydrogenase (short-subunit alcohol dehydrogenase family)